MNLLSLDTSTKHAIALATEAGLFCMTTPESVRRHGRDLIPQIGSLLEAAGIRAKDLDAIAVGLGPGSYTGLRVGVTAAKTLAYAVGRSSSPSTASRPSAAMHRPMPCSSP